MQVLGSLSLISPGSGRLVVIGDFEDVGCVDPVVGAASHYLVAGDHELVYGDIAVGLK